MGAIQCVGHRPDSLAHHGLLRGASDAAVEKTNAREVVERFFAAFGRRDLEAIVATFDDSAKIIAVRPGRPRDENPYGTYVGHDGVPAFVAGLGRHLATEAFAVREIVAGGHVALASGTFSHRVKSTGKRFSSGWALRCEVHDGKITSYRFYEDSAALALASE